jgi:hypothetical protein
MVKSRESTLHLCWHYTYLPILKEIVDVQVIVSTMIPSPQNPCPITLAVSRSESILKSLAFITDVRGSIEKVL